jgi:uncharacterized protein (TIGR03083 family)
VTGDDLLETSYSSLLDALDQLDSGRAWAPTRCPGWCVQDLVHHLCSDAERALVALHTPHPGPVDTDAVSYWRAWQPGGDADDKGRRDTRVMASVWTFAPLAARYAATAHAVVAASNERSGREVISTQGRSMTVDALRSTLAVEATVHHLDLGLPNPSGRGLAEVRRVLDGLIGRAAPIKDDVRYALVGTGREPLTADETALLGPDAERLPLFG